MPNFGSHALLQIIWVRAVPEHILIVIRLKKNRIALREMVGNRLGDNANVGHHANFAAVCFDHKTARVRRIVALAEGVHLNAKHIADIAWLKKAHFGGAELAAGVVKGFSGEVERQTEPLTNAVCAADVVGVLVRNEDSPHLTNINARRFRSIYQTFKVNARINQHGIALITNIITVAVTPRRQCAYLYHIFYQLIIFNHRIKPIQRITFLFYEYPQADKRI